MAAKAAATTASRSASLTAGRFKKSVLGSMCSCRVYAKPQSAPRARRLHQSRQQPCGRSNPQVRVLLAGAKPAGLSPPGALPCPVDARARRPSRSRGRRGAPDGVALLRRQHRGREAVLDRDLRRGGRLRRDRRGPRRPGSAGSALPDGAGRGRHARRLRLLEWGDDDLVGRARPVVGLAEPRGRLRRVRPARAGRGRDRALAGSARRRRTGRAALRGRRLGAAREGVPVAVPRRSPHRAVAQPDRLLERARAGVRPGAAARALGRDAALVAARAPGLRSAARSTSR